MHKIQFEEVPCQFNFPFTNKWNFCTMSRHVNSCRGIGMGMFTCNGYSDHACSHVHVFFIEFLSEKTLLYLFTA